MPHTLDSIAGLCQCVYGPWAPGSLSSLVHPDLAPLELYTCLLDTSKFYVQDERCMLWNVATSRSQSMQLQYKQFSTFHYNGKLQLQLPSLVTNNGYISGTAIVIIPSQLYVRGRSPWIVTIGRLHCWCGYNFQSRLCQSPSTGRCFRLRSIVVALSDLMHLAVLFSYKWDGSSWWRNVSDEVLNGEGGEHQAPSHSWAVAGSRTCQAARLSVMNFFKFVSRWHSLWRAFAIARNNTLKADTLNNAGMARWVFAF
eukprot:2399665-Amphidinium_carterae.1